MALTFNSSNAVFIGSGAAFTWTFTAPATTSGVLVVWTQGDGFFVPAALTWNGVSLTNFSSHGDSGGQQLACSVWYLVNPASGSHTLTSGGNQNSSLGQIVFAEFFDGARQATPLANFVTTDGLTGNTNTLSVTCAAGNMVCDQMFWDSTGGSTITAGGGQTVDYADTHNGVSHASAPSSMAWTGTSLGSAQFLHSAVEVRAASAGFLGSGDMSGGFDDMSGGM